MKLLIRLCRHIFILPSAVKRHFHSTALHRIEMAIEASEQTHTGQICFAVESNLSFLDVIKNKTARMRAVEVFSRLHIWDTAHNNGVLIYLLLADNDFEVIADRGIHQHVGDSGWEHICEQMEQQFRQGKFEAGVQLGISKIGEHLAQYYPSTGLSNNELSNAPIIL